MGGTGLEPVTPACRYWAIVRVRSLVIIRSCRRQRDRRDRGFRWRGRRSGSGDGGNWCGTSRLTPPATPRCSQRRSGLYAPTDERSSRRYRIANAMRRAKVAGGRDGAVSGGPEGQGAQPEAAVHDELGSRGVWAQLVGEEKQRRRAKLVRDALALERDLAHQLGALLRRHVR